MDGGLMGGGASECMSERVRERGEWGRVLGGLDAGDDEGDGDRDVGW